MGDAADVPMGHDHFGHLTAKSCIKLANALERVTPLDFGRHGPVVPGRGVEAHHQFDQGAHLDRRRRLPGGIARGRFARRAQSIISTRITLHLSAAVSN